MAILSALRSVISKPSLATLSAPRSETRADVGDTDGGAGDSISVGATSS